VPMSTITESSFRSIGAAIVGFLLSWLWLRAR
jgi:hypothetical protein